MNRNTLRRLSLLALLALTVMVGGVLADSGAGGQALLAPVVNDAVNCTSVVNAGQSIQAAVDNAQSGQIVCVRAGTYHEQVKIKEADAGITLTAYPGEKPVIDGRGVLPAATAKNKYMGLIHITGNNVTVDGFEVRDSAIRGIAVIQPPASSQPLQNVIVRNMIVHGSKDAGINVNGNDSVRPRNILIENNVVYNNLLKNSSGGAGGNGLTFIEVNNSTARGNVVYNNLGEGLVIGRWTENIILEDNITYDNQHANLYIVNTVNPTVRRNLVFCSDDRTYWSSKSPKKPSAGLQIRDENFENHSTPPPASTGHVIINNIVTGCSPNFGVSAQIHGGGLNNSLVANNTFANSRGDGGASINNVLFAGDANYANSRFVNNVLLQTTSALQLTQVPLVPDVANIFRVTAVNRDNVESTPSAILLVGTDTSPPSAPVGLVSGLVAPNRVDLTWSAANDPESGVSFYTIYRDGVSIGTSATITFSDSTPPAAGSIAYRVSATNGVAQESAQSAQLLVANYQQGVYPTAAYAGTIDSWISGSAANVNTNLNSTGFVRFDGVNSTNNEDRGMIRWDLSGLPAGGLVTSASITVNVSNDSVGQQYSLYALKRNWVESAWHRRFFRFGQSHLCAQRRGRCAVAAMGSRASQ